MRWDLGTIGILGLMLAAIAGCGGGEGGVSGGETAAREAGPTAIETMAAKAVKRQLDAAYAELRDAHDSIKACAAEYGDARASGDEVASAAAESCIEGESRQVERSSRRTVALAGRLAEFDPATLRRVRRASSP